MLKQISAEMEREMKKTVESFRGELASIRTGRASISLLDGIRVEYYGSKMALNQVASLSIPEARTIEIKPWDQNVLPEIEKAIHKSDLGINPNSDGQLIRISIPKLSEDRRKDLVKNIKKIAEQYRVTVRAFRRDSIEKIKKAQKEKSISEDEQKVGEHAVQKVTDANIHAIEEILSHKEKEMMEV